MAKVLFINPVVREEDDPRHVPYGMAMLAAIAGRHGHLVQVYDANAWRPPDHERALREVLEADCWDVIAIGGLSTTYGYIKRAVAAVKKYAPKALCMGGGGFLTSMPREIMQFLPGLDVGILGEAYLTFPEMLEKVDRRDFDWSGTKGVIYRDTEGRICLTPARELLRDIDSLPFPSWELFPHDIYFKNSMLLLSEVSMVAKRRLDINGSYGCSLFCRFCWHLGIAGDMKTVETSKGQDVAFTYDRDLRWHSPHYIVKMVKYAHERFGVDFISFLDENLMTMNVSTRGQWLPEICRLWIEEGLQPECIRRGIPHDPDTCKGVHFGGTSHAGLVDPQVLRLMRDAGCAYLDYGLESFSDRILKSVGKGSTTKLNERAIKITMEAGIRPIPNQIIGFPDEFFDSICENVEAWERMGVVAYPFFATAYPGSEWYYTYKDSILEQYNGDLEAYLLDLGDATKITAVISENFNAVELLGLRELMVKRDVKRIREYEKIWRRQKGEPRFPKFTAKGWRQWTGEEWLEGVSKQSPGDPQVIPIASLKETR